MVSNKAYIKCTAAANRSEVTEVKLARTPTSQNQVPVSPPVPPEWTTSIFPLVRRDFTDVWLFDKAENFSDISDAEGAVFSVSRDRLAQNTIWTAHAMGAVVFQVLHDRFPGRGRENDFNWVGFSVAPYITLDRVNNSNLNAQTNNVDQLTYGG